MAYATFHIARELAGAFLAHLAEHHLEVRDTPERLGQLGPKAQDVIEIELRDDTYAVAALEDIVDDFFATKNISNE